MKQPLADTTRIEVAKDLFENEIFPLLDVNTEVAVRLLRDTCDGKSKYHNFGHRISDCLNFIHGISASGHTPLYNTMRDALSTTLAHNASEKTIFVLTDGNDTCNIPLNQVLTTKELTYFNQINVIVAQFAVNSESETQQMLTQFANTIGAKTFNFASGPKSNIPNIRAELNTALRKVNLNRNSPLNHCFTELPGNPKSWKEIEEYGIQIHQSRILYEEKFLSWKPELAINVTPLQFAELKFLFGMRFKSGINVEMMRSMLAQLVKPYYYNNQCIFWDFEEARWKNFPKPLPIVTEKVIEKEVIKEVVKEVTKEVPVEVIKRYPYNVMIEKNYRKKGYYRIESVHDTTEKNSPDLFVNATTTDYFKLQECDKPKNNAITIKEGDIIKYEEKKTVGRPRKSTH
jgi:hypothetical protein